jgi:hypothetical protein
MGNTKGDKNRTMWSDERGGLRLTARLMRLVLALVIIAILVFDPLGIRTALWRMGMRAAERAAIALVRESMAERGMPLEAPEADGPATPGPDLEPASQDAEGEPAEDKGLLARLLEQAAWKLVNKQAEEAVAQVDATQQPSGRTLVGPDGLTEEGKDALSEAGKHKADEAMDKALDAGGDAAADLESNMPGWWPSFLTMSYWIQQVENATPAIGAAARPATPEPTGPVTPAATSNPTLAPIHTAQAAAATAAAQAMAAQEAAERPTIEPRVTPTPTPAARPIAPVQPVLEDVHENDDGSYTAVFSYVSQNDFTVYIPAGPENFMAPDPIDRQQPTTFRPGRSIDNPRGTFQATFEGGILQWTIMGHTATAAVFD